MSIFVLFHRHYFSHFSLNRISALFEIHVFFVRRPRSGIHTELHRTITTTDDLFQPKPDIICECMNRCICARQSSLSPLETEHRYWRLAWNSNTHAHLVLFCRHGIWKLSTHRLPASLPPTERRSKVSLHANNQAHLIELVILIGILMQRLTNRSRDISLRHLGGDGMEVDGAVYPFAIETCPCAATSGLVR